MNRRDFLKTSALGLGATMLLPGTARAASAASTASSGARPNIIVILTDDMGYADLGLHGCRDIPTPHIDSLARDGVRCTDAYVVAPLCSPSRAGLLTGRYPQRFGHEFNPPAGCGLSLTEATMAQRLHDLGYATGIVGKWHLGAEPQFLPMRRGFDEYYGTLANTPYYHPLLVDSRRGEQAVKVEDPGLYTTEAFAARAVEFIKSRRDSAVLPLPAFQRGPCPTRTASGRQIDIPKDARRPAPPLWGSRLRVGYGHRAGAFYPAGNGPGGEDSGILPERQRRARL